MGIKSHGPLLVEAIEKNDIKTVCEVLNKHFRNKQKATELVWSKVQRLNMEPTVPMILASSLHNAAILEYLLTTFGIDVNRTLIYGPPTKRKLVNCLLTAVKKGAFEAVMCLLTAGAITDTADHKQRTPLHLAVKRADLVISRLLLSKGANANAIDMAGNTPLHIACIYGHTQIVKLLLTSGSDPFVQSLFGALPIHVAAREGHSHLMPVICNLYSFNPNLKVSCFKQQEVSALHVASRRGHHETVLSLVEECGANVDIRDTNSNTPLHCCFLAPHEPTLDPRNKSEKADTAMTLLELGADPNVVNTQGDTPLTLATRHNFERGVEILVSMGASLSDNVDTKSNNTTMASNILKSASKDPITFMNETFDAMSRRSQFNNSSVNLHTNGNHENSYHTNGFIGNRCSSRMLSRSRVFDTVMSKRNSFRSQHSLIQQNQILNNYQKQFNGNCYQYPHDSNEQRFSFGHPQLNNQNQPYYLQQNYSNNQLQPKQQPMQKIIMNPSYNGIDNVDGEYFNQTAHNYNYPNSIRGNWSTNNEGILQETHFENFSSASTPRKKKKKKNKDGKRGRSLKSSRSRDDINSVTAQSLATSVSCEMINDDGSLSSATDVYDKKADFSSNKLKYVKREPPEGRPNGENSQSKSRNTSNKQQLNNIPDRTFDESFQTEDDLSSVVSSVFSSSSASVLKTPKKNKSSSKEVFKKCQSNEEKLGETIKIEIDKKQLADYTVYRLSNTFFRPKVYAVKKKLAERVERLMLKNNNFLKKLLKSEFDMISCLEAFEKFGVDDVLDDDEYKNISVREGCGGLKVKRIQKKTPDGKTKYDWLKRSFEPTIELNENINSIQNPTSPKNTPFYKKNDINLSKFKSKSPVKNTSPSYATNTMKNLNFNNVSERNQYNSKQNYKIHNNDIFTENNDLTKNSHFQTKIFSTFEDMITDNESLKNTVGTHSKMFSAISVNDIIKKMDEIHLNKNGIAPNFVQNHKTDLKNSTNFYPRNYQNHLGSETEINTNNNNNYIDDSFESDSFDDVSSEHNSETTVLQTRNNSAINGKSRFNYETNTHNDIYQNNFNRHDCGNLNKNEKIMSKRSFNDQNDTRSTSDLSTEDSSDNEQSSGESIDGEIFEILLNMNNIDKKNLKLILEGGNAVGLVVHKCSEAWQYAGLKELDEIVEIAGVKIDGKTKEAVYSILKNHIQNTNSTILKMIVRRGNMIRVGELINKTRNEGGDRFFVEANFDFEETNKNDRNWKDGASLDSGYAENGNDFKKDVLSFKKGDKFCVIDSKPDKCEGWWKVARADFRPGSQSRKHNAKHFLNEGFIPNKLNALFYLTNKFIFDSTKRSGTFMRSFRRQKSNPSAIPDFTAYYHVMLFPISHKKPVFISGLFSDSICRKLINDSPGLYEIPLKVVEMNRQQVLSDNEQNSHPLINVEALEEIMLKNKHPVCCISPKTIEYLKNKTEIDSILLLMSSPNKNITKEISKQLKGSSISNQSSSLFEESIKFEKKYAHLFDARLSFSSDNSWFSILKDTITKLQVIPRWKRVELIDDEDDSKIYRKKVNDDNLLPFIPFNKRISKTTDDLPEIQLDTSKSSLNKEQSMPQNMKSASSLANIFSGHITSPKKGRIQFKF